MAPMRAASFLRTFLFLVGLLSTAHVLEQTSFAQGYEFAALGTKPVGRAGAVHASIDDPLALLYNPANLSALGRSDRRRKSAWAAQLDVNLVFFDACYQRKSAPNNNYGDVTVGGETSVFGDSADYAGQAWPTACNEGPPNPNPTAILAWNPEHLPFGLAVGLLVPSAVGITKWADDENDTVTANGRALPPGHRFMALSQEVLVVQPSIGLGYDLGVLRLGATFQWGLAFANFNSHTAIAAVRGEDPDNSVGTVLDVKDLFVPGLILSAVVEPLEGLSLMAGFQWQDAVRGGGTIDFTTGVYGAGDAQAGIEGHIPSTKRANGVTFESPQPWYLNFGIRYAHQGGRIYSTSSCENCDDEIIVDERFDLWDIELDLRYSHSSVVDDFVISIPAGEMIDVQLVNDQGQLVSTPTSVPDRVTIPHRWRNQIAARLGGDFLVLPDLLTGRAGVSFESSGSRSPYNQLDFWPTARLGLHAGLTFALGDFDLSLSYAHIFNETVTTEPQEANVRQLVAVGNNPVAINAGTYASNIDVLSLGVVWRP